MKGVLLIKPKTFSSPSSATDYLLSHSQISDLRPGERDKVYVEAFERMCKSIMLVSNMESLDGKRVGDMSYLTLYECPASSSIFPLRPPKAVSFQTQLNWSRKLIYPMHTILFDLPNTSFP